jgi:mannose-6-phosphate isomerase-like protein (cupin superfamily)
VPPHAVDLASKLALFNDQWKPKIVGHLNDYDLKVVKIQGEFVWHSHLETDEFFLVLEGEMRIEFRDGVTPLKTGQLCVVPRGVEHRPMAAAECHLLLIEPQGTVNTGDAGGERTAIAEDFS